MTMAGDITLGSNTTYFGANLTSYIMNHTIPETRLDDMATRIIAAWYFLHQDEAYPNVTVDAFHPYNTLNQEVNAQADHAQVGREVAAGGTVLLKNEGCTLPLKKPKSIVLVGSDAGPSEMGPNQYPDQGGDPTGVLALGWGSG